MHLCQHQSLHQLLHLHQLLLQWWTLLPLLLLAPLLLPPAQLLLLLALLTLPRALWMLPKTLLALLKTLPVLRAMPPRKLLTLQKLQCQPLQPSQSFSQVKKPPQGGFFLPNYLCTDFSDFLTANLSGFNPAAARRGVCQHDFTVGRRDGFGKTVSGQRRCVVLQA